jgi:hypothetical protein
MSDDVSDTIGIHDFDQLCMICSVLIWNNTAWHSAMAHGCYEFYSFPPNRPTILHLPPLHRLDAGTADKYELMLPAKGETVLIQGFMTLISEIKVRRPHVNARQIGRHVFQVILRIDELSEFPIIRIEFTKKIIIIWYVFPQYLL